MFGMPLVDENGKPLYNEVGTRKARPHYIYTIKQVIEEKFILDVLKYCTPYQSYYHIVKTIEDDPLFDKRLAQIYLKYFVESNEFAIQEKVNIMVEHFHTEVQMKIGGRARAMVVTSDIKRAIEYYHAITRSLKERKSHYKAIISFYGDVV